MSIASSSFRSSDHAAQSARGPFPASCVSAGDGPSRGTIVGRDISAVAWNNSLTSCTGAFSGIAAGQWIRVGGFANAENNGYLQAVAVTADELVVAGATLVDEAAGPSIAVEASSMLRAGAGTGAGSSGCDRAATELDLLANVAPILAEAASIQGLRIDGELLMEVAWLGFTGVSWPLAVTGVVSARFASRALYEKHLNFGASPFSYRAVDCVGAVHVLTFPALKLIGGDPPAGGVDRDRPVEMAWIAYRDPDLGYAVQVDRFDAAR